MFIALGLKKTAQACRLQPDGIEIQEVNNWLHQSTLLAGPAHETEHLCQNRDIVIDFLVGMACSRHRDELVFDVQLLRIVEEVQQNRQTLPLKAFSC